MFVVLSATLRLIRPRELCALNIARITTIVTNVTCVVIIVFIVDKKRHKIGVTTNERTRVLCRS